MEFRLPVFTVNTSFIYEPIFKHDDSINNPKENTHIHVDPHGKYTRAAATIFCHFLRVHSKFHCKSIQVVSCSGKNDYEIFLIFCAELFQDFRELFVVLSSNIGRGMYCHH